MKRRLLALLLAAACLASTAGAADRGWRAIRGRNVEVFGQQPSRTLRDIAVELEQFRVVLGNLVRGARQPQPLPTEVYLFDDYDAMKPFLPLYQGKPAVVGGICLCGSGDDTSVILAALSRNPDSSEIVYHEYSHLLLRNAIGRIPVWFNEGLAEYFSTFELHGGTEAQVGRAIGRHVALLRERFIPLPQLLAVDRTSELYNEGTRRSIFYAESWALTHYLLLGRPDGPAAVNEYLNAYAAGAPSDQALAGAVGLSLKDLQSELQRYVTRLTFRAVTYTLSGRVAVDEPDAAAPIADADAAARLGEVQVRVDRLDEAMPRIEKAAAAAPPAGRAQLALARLRLRQDRKEEAWHALQQAVSLSANDFAAQFLYGLTLLRGNGAHAEPPTDRAGEAHAALARAVAIRPESAAALAWLAYADLESGANLDEARDATAKAMALAPGRLDYAVQLAEVRLRAGDAVGARQLLTPIAKSGGDTEEADHAARILKLLDDRDRRSREAAAAGADGPTPRDTDTVEVTFDDSDAVARAAQNGARIVFRLRELGPGEQRLFGDLLEVACSPAGIRFRVRSGGREFDADAARMEDVQLTAYGNTGELTVACGARVPPDRVYLTWKAGGGGPRGTAVALEFMPKGYVP